MQKTLTWSSAGAMLFGLIAYFSLSRYLDLSPFDDYKHLVGLSALAGGGIGAAIGRFLKSGDCGLPPPAKDGAP